MIVLHSSKEIEMMRKACQMASSLLEHLGKMVEPGISTEKIDQEAHRWAKEKGCINAPFNYKGGANAPFPGAVCISIDDVICHGKPSDDKLKDGSIVNIDVSPLVDGWHGDTSKTFRVGSVSDTADKLVITTEECLFKGIGQVKPGAFLGDIGAVIQEHAEQNGFSVVREFVGHGIGRKFHCAPTVPHFGIAGSGIQLREGMIFTIEPMINAGKPDVKMLDEWVAVTKDGSLSAQFEHTVLVTSDGAEILTKG